MIENKHIIELNHVSKIFDDDTIAVNDFNLYVRKGEFVTFLGPSGCGKSTTLRMIAGFDFPTKGEILLNGKDISSMPPNKRPINMVFQRYALFPHLDVFENVAFGLRLKKIPIQKMDKNGQPILKINNKKVSDIKDDIKSTKKNRHLTEEEKLEKLASLNKLLEAAKTTPEPTYDYRKLTPKEISTRVSRGLKIVDLDSLEDRDVTTLSGGQQQRVAIARAIVNEPEILLLDEPLGALDLKMRKDMQIELKEMHEKLGITFIYVTHDQEEALTMSDTIVVMKDGVIQQIGTPKSIYDEPKNAFVADFIGESNIYNATMIGKMRVRFLDHNFSCLDDFPINEKVDVVVRPEDVIFVKDPSKGMIKGTIITKIFKGVNYQYTVMVGKNELLVKDTHDFPINEEIGIDIEKDSIQIMKKDFTTNIYTDAWIDKNNAVQIDDNPFVCDITQILPGSKLEDGNLISKDGKHRYNFNDADVVAEIALDKIDIVDDLSSSECQAIGEIVDSVYKGDHYQYIIRTENDEDFVCITPYNYNLNDKVGVHVKPEDIKLRLKKEISEYEI